MTLTHSSSVASQSQLRLGLWRVRQIHARRFRAEISAASLAARDEGDEVVQGGQELAAGEHQAGHDRLHGAVGRRENRQRHHREEHQQADDALGLRHELQLAGGVHDEHRARDRGEVPERVVPTPGNAYVTNPINLPLFLAYFVTNVLPGVGTSRRS